MPAAFPVLVAMALLSACSRSAKPDASALCTDLGQVRQLISDAGKGLSPQAQIGRIQSLEGSLSADAMTLGEQGDAVDGAAVAKITVALGNWKTDITLDQDPAGVEQDIEQAIGQVSTCG